MNPMSLFEVAQSQHQDHLEKAATRRLAKTLPHQNSGGQLQYLVKQILKVIRPEPIVGQTRQATPVFFKK